MSKDEVSRQIEEMQKYLKEQEELNNKPAVVAPEGGSAEPEDLYTGEEEVLEPEIVGGPGSVNNADPAQNNKNGCGCGCFSFIIFIIFASILISFAGSVFRMLSF